MSDKSLEAVAAEVAAKLTEAEACARFAARHDHDEPCRYDFNRHPDDPSYGMRVSVFGRA